MGIFALFHVSQFGENFAAFLYFISNLGNRKWISHKFLHTFYTNFTYFVEIVHGETNANSCIC
jgi:hypothetical protein